MYEFRWVLFTKIYSFIQLSVIIIIFSEVV